MPDEVGALVQRDALLSRARPRRRGRAPRCSACSRRARSSRPGRPTSRRADAASRATSSVQWRRLPRWYAASSSRPRSGSRPSRAGCSPRSAARSSAFSMLEEVSAPSRGSAGTEATAGAFVYPPRKAHRRAPSRPARRPLLGRVAALARSALRRGVARASAACRPRRAAAMPSRGVRRAAAPARPRSRSREVVLGRQQLAEMIVAVDRADAAPRRRPRAKASAKRAARSRLREAPQRRSAGAPSSCAATAPASSRSAASRRARRLGRGRGARRKAAIAVAERERVVESARQPRRCSPAPCAAAASSARAGLEHASSRRPGSHELLQDARVAASRAGRRRTRPRRRRGALWRSRHSVRKRADLDLGVGPARRRR